MSTLNEFLRQKRRALLAIRERAKTENTGPHTMRASTSAEGRSGIRRIRIRDFQIISDSGPEFAGYDLGPSSPELQLGVLSSCLTHVFLIHAAERNIPLTSLNVEVTAQINPNAGQPGYEDIPTYPHNITYTVNVSSPASDEDIAALHTIVERACPIFNLLVNPQRINGNIVHTTPVEQVSKPTVVS